jgi:hypothetical protein
MMEELQSIKYEETELKETKQLWYTVAGVSRRRGAWGTAQRRRARGGRPRGSHLYSNSTTDMDAST